MILACGGYYSVLCSLSSVYTTSNFLFPESFLFGVNDQNDFLIDSDWFHILRVLFELAVSM